MTDQDTFSDGLARVAPHLRAFAISLSGNRSEADDLVQETLLRAWKAQASLKDPRALKSWTFTILRNLFLEQKRKSRWEVEDVDGEFAANEATSPNQLARLHLDDVQNALQTLKPEFREVLILVGAEGISYEDAAAIAGVEVGTIKSRLSRARSQLASALGDEAKPPQPPRRPTHRPRRALATAQLQSTIL